MTLDKEILDTCIKVNHELSRRFRSHYGKINLTYPQGVVLSVLSTEGTLPISTLAELTGSANSTISGVVDRLEKMGLVRRVRSETDRRVIYVELTEKYDEIHQLATTSVHDYFSELMVDVSEEDGRAILRGMELMCRALERDI